MKLLKYTKKLLSNAVGGSQKMFRTNQGTRAEMPTFVE